MKLKNITLNIICLLITNLNAISLRDYITQNGIPKVVNNELEIHLDLSEKNLTDLNGLSDIPEIDTITSLYLSNNELTELSENTFDRLPNLQYLYLVNNKLRRLPENIFGRLNNLRFLDLHNNELEELSENIFDGLDNLKLLGLSKNKLKRLPENIFSRLYNLVSLQLRDNQLSTLSNNTFNSLINLEKLNLTNNELTTLSNGIFKGLVKLEYLDIYNNRLETLSDNTFTGLSNLKELMLYNNKLKKLSDDIFKELINLKRLEIYNNEIEYTNQEFTTKYLTTQQRALIFIFKTPEQEEAESIQRSLIENINSDNETIDDILAQLRIIKQTSPDLYTVAQSDNNGNTALHLALLKGNIDLAKKIFDVIPESMYKTNNLGKNPMYLLLLFAHVPNRYDATEIPDDDKRLNKNEEYNMVCILAFLKYIFAHDSNLTQLLYENDTKDINPIESLRPSGREQLIQALFKLAEPVFIAPFSDLSNEELTAI